jgi:hypothetical protein
MAIVIKDGYKFFDNSSGKPTSMLLTGEIDVKTQLDYAMSNNIRSISISGFFGFSEDNLDFLVDYPFIESIDVTDIDINIEGIYYLSGLERLTLGVKSKKQHLEISRLKCLTFLSIDWYPEVSNLFSNEHLKELYIWKYKPRSKSFSQLSLPDSLNLLHVADSNILSFEGIEASSLLVFEAHHCSSLSSLKGIEAISSNLATLILDYCKKLTEYDSIQSCRNLSKLILGDCGDIPALVWLNKLPQLKYFSFYNTKVANGDISPCIGIDYVSFKNNKIYNMRQEDFK